MIHEAFNKSIIAVKYYHYSKGITLTPQAACKKFFQDKNINKATLQLVVSSIFAEQKKLLKWNATTFKTRSFAETATEPA